MDKLFGEIGFVLLMFGAAGMDSPSLLAPVVMVIIGAVLIRVAAYESGDIRKRK